MYIPKAPVTYGLSILKLTVSKQNVDRNGWLTGILDVFFSFSSLSKFQVWMNIPHNARIFMAATYPWTAVFQHPLTASLHCSASSYPTGITIMPVSHEAELCPYFLWRPIFCSWLVLFLVPTFRSSSPILPLCLASGYPSQASFSSHLPIWYTQAIVTYKISCLLAVFEQQHADQVVQGERCTSLGAHSVGNIEGFETILTNLGEKKKPHNH